MKDRIRKFVAWFDARRRQAAQVALTSLATLLVGVGVATETVTEPWLIISAAVLQAAGPLLAVVNLKRSQWASWFTTTARGVLYGLAAAVAPALSVLGFISEDQSALALTGISLGLTVLSNMIAVFTSAQQEAQHARDVAVVGALTSPVAGQIASLAAAANRLGIDEADVTRAMYRSVGEDSIAGEG